jgi:hypothetical protein
MKMALIINGVPIEKGKAYTIQDLKFTPNQVISGNGITKEKEKVLLITIDYKYKNELHSDGVVHEPKNEKHLYDYGEIKKEKIHLFVRHCHKGVYLYIGKMTYVTHYDRDRNKLFIKNTKKKSSATKKKIKGK